MVLMERKGFLPERDFPNEAGQPVPRTRVELTYWKYQKKKWLMV